MKKISIVLALILCILSLFGCGKEEIRSEDIPAKEYEDYDDFSGKGYSLKYDDNKFKHEKSDGCEIFTLVGSDDKETFVKVESHENAQMESITKEAQKSYESKGLSSVSAIETNIFGTQGAMDISAYSEDGNRVYETFVIKNNGDVIELSYSYSTDLSQTAIGNAIDSLVHSFTLK